MKKNGLVWNFLEPQAVETSDHTNKTNKYLIPTGTLLCAYCILLTLSTTNTTLLVFFEVLATRRSIAT